MYKTKAVYGPDVVELTEKLQSILDEVGNREIVSVTQSSHVDADEDDSIFVTVIWKD